MILILSKAINEYSTDIIVGYLTKMNANFIRINGADLLNSGVYIDIKGNKLFVNDKIISFDEIKVVFNRRWYDREEFELQNLPDIYNLTDIHQVQEEIRSEFLTLSQYFKSKFKNAIWIPHRTSVNKLIVLEKAIEFGLLIPDSYICSLKNQLNKLRKRHPAGIVTKAIGDIFPIQGEKQLLSFLTKEVNEELISSCAKSFFPSFFQEKISKDYEVRVFYWFGKTYSMAIFSQNDKKTEIDFRNYNYEKPNRVCAYNIPKDIEDKIHLLMDDLDLNTGSIDLICIGKKYYFLEVNPVGQFGMVSYPCGYDLHKVIVDELIKLDKDEK